MIIPKLLNVVRCLALLCKSKCAATTSRRNFSSSQACPRLYENFLPYEPVGLEQLLEAVGITPLGHIWPNKYSNQRY